MTADDFIFEGHSLIEKGKKLIEYGEQLKNGEPVKRKKKLPMHKDPAALARIDEMIFKSQMKYLAKHNLK